MAGEQITRDGQYELRGLLLGPGTPYRMIESVPFGFTVRASDELRARDHGAFVGDDFLDVRRISFTVYVDGDDQADGITKLQTLGAAFAPGTNGPIPLAFQRGGQKFLAFGRPRMHEPAPVGILTGQLEVAARFLASDPLLYSASLDSETVGLPSATTGFTFDMTFNLAFGGGGSGGTVLADNTGTFPSRPVATITGPTSGTLTNPRIENVTADAQIELDLDLGVGDSIEIDFDARSILLNGTASRRSALTPFSEWWELAPGVNEVRFGAQSAPAGASLTLEWRSAWTI